MNVDKSCKTKNHFNISDYRNSSSSYLPNQQNNTILNSSISTSLRSLDSNNHSYNNQNFSNNNNDFVENNNYNNNNNNSFSSTTSIDNYNSNQNSRYSRGKRIPVEEDINYFNSNNSNSNFEESTSNSGQSKKIKIEQFVDTTRKEYSGSYSYDNLTDYKINYNNKSKTISNIHHPHSQTPFNSQSLPTNYSSSSNNNTVSTDIRRHPISNSENQLSTSYYPNPSYNPDNINNNSTSSNNTIISATNSNNSIRSNSNNTNNNNNNNRNNNNNNNITINNNNNNNNNITINNNNNNITINNNNPNINNNKNNNSINNTYNNPNTINSGYSYQSSHPQYQHSTNSLPNNSTVYPNNQNPSQPLHSANMTPSIQTTESSSGDSFQMSVKRKSLSIMSIDNITNNNEEYQQKKEAKKVNNSDNYLTKNSNSSPTSISKSPLTSNGQHHDTVKSMTNHNSQRDATSRNSNTEDTNNTSSTDNSATTKDPINPATAITNRSTTTTTTTNNKLNSSAAVKKLSSSSSLSISRSKSNNTNSCIYLPRNFYEVEMNHLIYLIAEMLEKLTKYNDQITLTKENLTRFHSRKAPDISIYDYLKRIVKYAAIDKVALLSLLIYIDRICKRHRMFTISSLTVHRFIITSLTCASKAMCDSICTNTHYSKVGGIHIKELNLLELEFLFLIDWHLACTDVSELQQYYVNLVRQSSIYHLMPDPEENNKINNNNNNDSNWGSHQDITTTNSNNYNNNTTYKGLQDVD